MRSITGTTLTRGTVADSPSIEQRLGRRVGQALRGLGPNEKLASLGVLAIFISMLLPWYGAPIGDDLAQSGFGAFNFATAALLLTSIAVLFLCTEVGDGYKPPRPLSVGSLLIAGGIWCVLLLVFLMLDRPQLELAQLRGFGGVVDDDFDVRYGLFVAVGGAATIVMAGVRRRRYEVTHRVRHADDDLEEIEIEEDEEN